MEPDNITVNYWTGKSGFIANEALQPPNQTSNFLQSLIFWSLASVTVTTR